MSAGQKYITAGHIWVGMYMQFGPKFLLWIGQFTGFKDNFYVFIIEGDVTLSRLCAH